MDMQSRAHPTGDALAGCIIKLPLMFVLMGIGYLLHFAPDSWQDACCRGVVKLPLLGKALLLVVLIYLVIQIKSSDIQPFIYFQF